MLRRPDDASGYGCLPERTRWRSIVYGGVFALTPLLAYVWPLGFSVLAPVGFVLLLLLWARPQPGWPVVALLAGLTVWAAGSFGWSPAEARADPQNVETQAALKLLAQLPAYGFLALGAAGLSGRGAARALGLLAAGAVVLGLVLVLEGASSARGYQALLAAMGEPIRPDLAERNVGKGQFVLAVLAWPVLVHLKGTRARLVPLLAGTILLCPLVLNELAPVIAFAAGGLAFLVVRAWGFWGARAIGVALAVQVLVSPWVVRAAVDGGLFQALSAMLPASWSQRLAIWDFVSARALEQPWTGWGLEASRTFPAVPLHPHNAGLQVWLELGLVGAALFALVWFRLSESIARLAREDRTAAAAAAGAAGAYFTIGALSYGVWQEWWLALGAVAVAVCLALAAARRRERLAWGREPLQDYGLTPL